TQMTSLVVEASVRFMRFFFFRLRVAPPEEKSQQHSKSQCPENENACDGNGDPREHGYPDRDDQSCPRTGNVNPTVFADEARLARRTGASLLRVVPLALRRRIGFVRHIVQFTSFATRGGLRRSYL